MWLGTGLGLVQASTGHGLARYRVRLGLVSAWYRYRVPSGNYGVVLVLGVVSFVKMWLGIRFCSSHISIGLGIGVGTSQQVQVQV